MRMSIYKKIEANYFIRIKNLIFVNISLAKRKRKNVISFK
jgi:hypothetical protein